MRLEGKTALVTGAGAGIGLAVTARFRDEGAHVFALDRDASLLNAIEGVERLPIDLLDQAAIASLPARIGMIDVLANVAGYVHSGNILACDEASWDLSFDLNVTAIYRMIRAFLPGMLDNGGGSIINVSSVASSIKGVPNRFAYGASKAAVIGLSKAVAADFVAQGVRSNVICPGTVESPSLSARMVEQAHDSGIPLAEVEAAFIARQPMGRLGRADEIASLALYLASDEAAFTTGAVHTIDGGWIN